MVYNNTIVDNIRNIRITHPTADDSIEIKNNISYLVTDVPSYHVSSDSPAGVTWSHNLYYPDSIDTVGGNADDNAIVNEDPLLSKTSGWRSLSIGSLDGTEFSLQSGSAAIDNAVAIASYNDRITYSDYTASPISVTVETISSDQDIGAWEYNEDTTPPAKPTGLIVVE